MFKRIAQTLFPDTAKAASVPQEHRLRIAACVVLLEAARADEDFTNEEQAHVLAVLRERFELSPEEAAELLEESTQHREASSDLWRFTNEINQAFTPKEKQCMMEEVWRLFYSDGELGAHEDGLAHQLRNLLNLNHPQMIRAKLKVLEEMRDSGEISGG